MQNAEFVRLVGHALRESKQLPPAAKRSPAAAFLVGVLLGPFGLGIYLKSWVDFLVPLALIIVGSIMTVGLGAPFFWLMCGFWGAARARSSSSGT